MVAGDIIYLEKLNLEELVGVVTLYPWYAGARKELCRRMAELGEGAWGENRFADEALYICSRSIIFNLMRSGRGLADTNVGKIINDMLQNAPQMPAPTKKDRPYRGVGDYFGASEYQDVKKSDDNIFSSFAVNVDPDGELGKVPDAQTAEFLTETLAQVYLDQGYPEEAISIYSKLSLRYPEKSVYFAALIDKIENKI